MKKAVIIDTYSRGAYHEVINCSYAIMISKCYDRVEYIADRSCCVVMKKMLKQIGCGDNIIFKEKNFVSIKIKGGIGWILKLIHVSSYNFYYYITSPKKADVFYNNNIFFAILFNLFFSKFKGRQFILCHSELEVIVRDTVLQSRTQQFVGMFFRFIFGKVRLTNGYHFILLGDNMKEYFQNKIADFNRTKIYALDHAYFRPMVDQKKTEIFQSSIFKIGLPGLINENRGLQELNNLIGNVTNQQVCIYSVSQVVGNVEDQNGVFQSLNNTDGLLPYEIYTNYIEQMDVLLFVYKLNSYKLTASGAILEAIWNQKPVIALKNDYFSYLFDKFGDMGVLCNSIEELSVLVNNFETIESKMEIYIENLNKAREALLPDNLVKNLMQIIER